jgi:type I restriction enzyme, S subunit
MRDGWVETTLGDVAKVTSGFAFSTKSWKEHGIPVIKINNVRNGQVSIENCSYIQEPVPEGASKFLLKQGDLLITLTGEIGAIGFVTQSLPMYLNQRVGRLDLLAREKVSLEFIGLFFSLPEVRAEMWSHGKGNAQLNISPTSIQSLTINLPPLPEQKRIVDFISSVDSYIEALQQQLESAKRSRNAVLHALLTAGGDDWVEKSLGEIAEVIGGGTPSTTIGEYWEGDIVWLTPTEISSQDGKVVSDSIRKITDLGFKNSGAQMLPKDSVILTSRASVGFVALAGKELCTNQGFQSLIPKPSVLSKFLMFWIQLNRPEFESRSAGSTFKEISKSNVKSIKLELPPLPEQKRIIEIVNTLDEVVSQTELTTSKAQNLRSGLLSDLLSGEHEIPVTYDKVMGAA